jgi:hypothetical protein
VEPGFAPERVLTAQVSLPRARYASDTLQARFWAQLLPGCARSRARARPAS